MPRRSKASTTAALRVSVVENETKILTRDDAAPDVQAIGPNPNARGNGQSHLIRLAPHRLVDPTGIITEARQPIHPNKPTFNVTPPAGH